MRKITLLLTAVLSMMAWTGVMAQTDEQYNAALEAIENGAQYYITTDVSGTTYYLTTTGTLTSTKSEGGIFTLTQKTGGGYKNIGFLVDGGGTRFSNPVGTTDASFTQGKLNTSTNNRATYESQVFFYDGSKYAVRACNVPYASSGWNYCGSTFWTVNPGPLAEYSLTASFVWELVKPGKLVTVTYKLYEADGTTVVSSTNVTQEANTDVNVPASMTSIYAYTYAVTGTIGEEDCEIAIVRTPKAGIVTALTDLSNTKAYEIGCNRGLFLTKDDYLASTRHSSLTNAEPSKFAIITYEDNKYLYSVADSKFVTNSGALSQLPTNGVYDAIQMGTMSGFYSLWTFKINDTTTYGINTNGNDPYGYVINSWVNADEGNQYFMIEVADFDPTDALAALEAYFHPSYFVTYVVKDEAGNIIFNSGEQPTMLGATITTLPADYQCPFYYTYNEVDVTISELNTTVEFTATWTGPFEISADFDNAHWYNMTIRGTWYVTSDNVASDGALKSVNANAYGLATDAYQWAFVGNGYDGFKVFNKDKGANYAYAWTAASNEHIPTFQAAESANVWTIKPSTASGYTDAFMLTIPTYGYQVNQFGGAGGSLKVWNATGTTDAGSAFNVFDVPSNFSEYVTAEIAPYFDTTAKYFVLTDAAKAAVGYNESYKTDCPYATYKAMKDALATALADADNFVYPETGYYRLKSNYYDGYTFSYADNSGTPGIVGFENAEKTVASVVTLTALDDHKYTISVEGLYAGAPVRSTLVTLSETPVEFTAVPAGLGGAFYTTAADDTYGALHINAAKQLVGWTYDAGASQWTVEDAEDIQLEVSEAGYATTYLPFPVVVPDDVTAYAAVFKDTWLDLNAFPNRIPEGSAAVLKADAAGTYTFNIGNGLKISDTEVDTNEALAKPLTELVEENVLKGTFVPIDATGKYVLAQPDEHDPGFYYVKEGTLAANKAYLEVSSEVKGFTFNFVEEDPTGIDLSPLTIEHSKEAVYNLAGQRLQKMQRGVNIVGGKKVLF